MFTDSVVLSLYFETPLHAPSGSVVGPVDYPVQRERTTQWPVIHATTLEEAIRTAVTLSKDEQTADTLFGQGGFDNADRALSVGDARILLFPVRSSAAPFLWITCPSVLSRLRRDLSRTASFSLPQTPQVKSDEILVTTAWKHGEEAIAAEDVVLHPRKALELAALLDFLPTDSPAYENFNKEVEASLGLVSDEVFGFLVRSATEVRPHGGISADTKRPSFIEAVPSDTVFYVPIEGRKLGEEAAVDVLKSALRPHMSVGKGQHVGWGWARTRVLGTAGGDQ